MAVFINHAVDEYKGSSDQSTTTHAKLWHALINFIFQPVYGAAEPPTSGARATSCVSVVNPKLYCKHKICNKNKHVRIVYVSHSNIYSIKEVHNVHHGLNPFKRIML